MTMELLIKSINWTAEVYLIPQDDGIVHCQIYTAGISQEIVLEAAVKVCNLFAKGREAYFRTLPEAASDTDFDTKETKHRGFTRFSFREESGQWHLPDKSREDEIKFIGLASLV